MTDKAIEPGAAHIKLELSGGNITVTHGGEKTVLMFLEQVPKGSWNRILEFIKNIKEEIPDEIYNEEDDEPQFSYKDKSGRGVTGQFSGEELLHLATHEAGLVDETSYDGDTLQEWYEKPPEVEDVWENAANKITRIK
jgi:hypothetical protein